MPGKKIHKEDEKNLIIALIEAIIAISLYELLKGCFDWLNPTVLAGIIFFIGLTTWWIIQKKLRASRRSIWFFGILPFVGFFVLATLILHQKPPTPTVTGVFKISITNIPPFDPVGGPTTHGDIGGRVEGIGNSTNYAVVIYARTISWYVQPESGNELTVIDLDGQWNTWTHLGSNYAALLVQKPYKAIPQLDALPAISGNVIARTQVEGIKPKAK